MMIFINCIFIECNSIFTHCLMLEKNTDSSFTKINRNIKISQHFINEISTKFTSIEVKSIFPRAKSELFTGEHNIVCLMNINILSYLSDVINDNYNKRNFQFLSCFSKIVPKWIHNFKFSTSLDRRSHELSSMFHTTCYTFVESIKRFINYWTILRKILTVLHKCISYFVLTFESYA